MKPSLRAACLAVLLACPAAGSTPSSTAGESREAGAVAPTAAPQRPAASPTESVAPSLPAPPTFRPGPLEVVVGEQAPRTPGAMLARTREPEDFTVHVSRAGFSADGARFMYCARYSGADCVRCEVIGEGGARERLDAGDECGRSKQALEKELQARGLVPADGAWAYGGELVIAVAEPEGRAKTLKIGASLRSGGAGGFVRTEDLCERAADRPGCWPLAEVDVVVPSPDGQRIAAVVHFNEGEHEDEYRAVMLSASSLAAAAFRARGLAALKEGELAVAAEMFLRETHADATSWKGPYNLACAYARAGDPASEAALREAVRRDEAAVRRRAGGDADLDAVRGQPWFAALVGGSLRE